MQKATMRFLPVAALLAVGCGARPEAGKSVLLISLDTLRADHTGLGGYERDTTPHLDALAKRSVVFTRAYAQAPETAPSHGSVFTGRYPSTHGLENVGTLEPAHAEEILAGNYEHVQTLDPQLPTLAEILVAAGWTAEAVTGGGELLPHLGVGRGFQRYFARRWPVDQAVDEGRSTLARLREAGSPWFLFWHTYEIHSPYMPPAEWDLWSAADSELSAWVRTGRAPKELLDTREPYEMSADSEVMVQMRDLYDGGISFTDHELGRWLDEMEASGALDECVLVVMSDHGEEFGEHGGILHDGRLQEEHLAVPLLVHLPGDRLGGTRIETPVGLIDLFPTLLDLVDAPAAAPYDGRSLVGLMEGAGAARPVFSEVRWRPREIWKVAMREGGALEIVEPFRGLDESVPAPLGAFVVEQGLADNARPKGPPAVLTQQEALELEALGYLNR